VLSDRNVNLLDDHVDAAVRIGRMPDSSLVAIGLGAVRRVVCASGSYLSARGEPVDPAGLGAHDCIGFESLSAMDAWTFRSGKTEVSVPLRPRLVVNTAEAAIDAAVAGLGITRVLSYQVADARRAGTLRIILDGYEPAAWPVSLVHAGQGILPLKLRAFLDFAAPRLRISLALSAS